MPTKVPEKCPRCNVNVMPNDDPVTYAGIDTSFTIRVWNYDCLVCDYTWANEAQRAHNRKEYNKKYKLSKYSGWYS